ncbi:DUF1801 domain-containing protein [Arthrobacter sp. 260]|uniref:iron chaperone n=1 Tax=Arthrobacter sp. 260 TaxID=2735314 RepID=UPI00149202A8|nr:DUF1801 domain-containing protein [Arthrobacter sp. 260]NOJ59798.1 DUF1801 domain-containing protein [Arthrobacter sp. 260]
MAEKAKSIEEYLNALDPEYRTELERIRTLVQQLVPGTEEAISYGMPTLKYKNRALVYFTASKKHMSFYPSSWAIDELRDQLQHYKTTEHAIAHPRIGRIRWESRIRPMCPIPGS